MRLHIQIKPGNFTCRGILMQQNLETSRAWNFNANKTWKFHVPWNFNANKTWNFHVPWNSNAIKSLKTSRTVEFQCNIKLKKFTDRGILMWKLHVP